MRHGLRVCRALPEDDPLIVEVGGDLQAHRKVRPRQIRGSAGYSSLLLGPVPRRVAAVGRSPGRGGTAPRHRPGGAGRRSRMSPSFQRCTLRAWSRTISIMDSTGLVEATVRSSAPVTPRRVTVNISAKALAEAAGGVRVELLQLTGECLEVPGRLVGV